MEELRELPVRERLMVVETALRLIREDLQVGRMESGIFQGIDHLAYT